MTEARTNGKLGPAVAPMSLQDAADPGFWNGQRITVTGGRGFLGRALVRLITEAGAQVSTFSSQECTRI
jgi:NADPH:quinone reductase-like Zn-dependent oxidoreductase